MKRIATLLMLISVHSFAQIERQNSPDWKTYTHDNYSIQYPQSWSFQENQHGATLYIVAPVDSFHPEFNVNINLVIQDLKGQGMSLDGYNNLSIKQIQKYLKNDTLLKDERVRHMIDQYWEVVYVGDLNGNHLEFEQFYRIIKEKAYIVTVTMLSKQWSTWHDVGEKILKTFTVN